MPSASRSSRSGSSHTSSRGSESSSSTAAKVRSAEFVKGSQSEDLSSFVCGSHICVNEIVVDGDTFMCHHNLWASSANKGVDSLARQRTRFLALSDADKRRTLLEIIQFESVGPNLEQSDVEAVGKPKDAKVMYRVGDTAGSQRSVCKCIFILAHFPTSSSNLKRRVAEERRQGMPMPSNNQEHNAVDSKTQAAKLSNKTGHIIS
eukprot:1797980-Pleurochrysis_carterae.AAC.1